MRLSMSNPDESPDILADPRKCQGPASYVKEYTQ